ncbi:Asp/Glu racemase [Vibrio penaeicida]|uniref:maleate cis-trans isomerase family protein n=1 Tax=Vibrio penaeicida TaxID=104609 RepID=UPI0027330016|nr:Asp/Glu racemase [Vibrio penaeicida]MDP2572540.1 Asp/Glu racemase [Vibrio penaeicida]
MLVDTIAPTLPLDNLAPSGKVGVIALATDFNIESDLRKIYPSDVQPFTSRVRNVNPLTIDNLQKMAPGISAAADSILPGTALDVVIYACTSGTVAIGEQKVTELIHSTRPNTLVTNPLSASIKAIQTLGATRISILTPYTESVNHAIATHYSENGFDVLSVAGFGFDDDTQMTFISPKDIAQAALSSCHSDAELLFISCTALRASGVIEQIEQELGKPVVTSNQALAWHSLTLMHYPNSLSGFGVLLSEHLGKNT